MTAPAGKRWTCEQCGEAFARGKSGDRPIRFCGSSCYQAWNKLNGSGHGRFPKGCQPWNKGIVGLHASPATEFQKGRAALNKQPIGAVAIRKCKGGVRRAFVKVAEPNRWRERAKVVWEIANGPLSKGLLVHHRDRNPLNDTLGNLQAMTRAEHIAEHREDYQAAKARKRRQPRLFAEPAPKPEQLDLAPCA